MITEKDLKAIYQSLGGYRVYLGHNQEKDDDSYCPELAVWYDENNLDYIKLPRKGKPTAGIINKILKELIDSGVHKVVLRFRTYHRSERKHFDPSEWYPEEITIYQK